MGATDRSRAYLAPASTALLWTAPISVPGLSSVSVQTHECRLDEIVVYIRLNLSALIGLIWTNRANCKQSGISMGADDEAAQQVSILYLPEEVMQAVFSLLNANELARAQCVCKLWKDAGEQPELWRRLHDERWRHASLNQWEELRSQGLWYKIFCERAKVCHVSPPNMRLPLGHVI